MRAGENKLYFCGSGWFSLLTKSIYEKIVVWQERRQNCRYLVQLWSRSTKQLSNIEIGSLTEKDWIKSNLEFIIKYISVLHLKIMNNVLRNSIFKLFLNQLKLVTDNKRRTVTTSAVVWEGRRHRPYSHFVIHLLLSFTENLSAVLICFHYVKKQKTVAWAPQQWHQNMLEVKVF